MAVSPFAVHDGVADLKVTAAKAKSLAVRINVSTNGVQQSNQSSSRVGPELAEQLNEDTKQKYVKGKRQRVLLLWSVC